MKIIDNHPNHLTMINNNKFFGDAGNFGRFSKFSQASKNLWSIHMIILWFSFWFSKIFPYFCEIRKQWFFYFPQDPVKNMYCLFLNSWQKNRWKWLEIIQILQISSNNRQKIIILEDWENFVNLPKFAQSWRIFHLWFLLFLWFLSASRIIQKNV